MVEAVISSSDTANPRSSRVFNWVLSTQQSSLDAVTYVKGPDSDIDLSKPSSPASASRNQPHVAKTEAMPKHLKLAVAGVQARQRNVLSGQTFQKYAELKQQHRSAAERTAQPGARASQALNAKLQSTVRNAPPATITKRIDPNAEQKMQKSLSPRGRMGLNAALSVVAMFDPLTAVGVVAAHTIKPKAPVVGIDSSPKLGATPAAAKRPKASPHRSAFLAYTA